MKFLNVFIDLDDTLCDTYGATQSALEAIFSECHLSALFASADDFYARFGQSNAHVWRQFSLGLMDFDTLCLQRFLPLVGHSQADHVARRFHQLYMQSVHLMPGAMELLLQCRHSGLRIFLCTNGSARLQRQKLEICQLERLFDGVFISEEVGAAKPSEAFFRHSLCCAHALPAQSVMIGDNYDSDIVGARRVGLSTILFNRWDACFVPPAPVDFIVTSLGEVAHLLQ